MIAAKKSRLGFTAFLGSLSCVAAAQGAVQPVSWSISASPGASAKPGNRLTLDLTAHIDDGWHVYAFNQAEAGPTPLRITADTNGIVQLAGAPTGTSPIRKHDSSFDLDTEIFNHLVTLHVPVVVKPSAAGGSEEIALNVRYQACNDHVCLPPRTVHLTVPAKTPQESR
jgi:DsbC/DsbD-like thiol-disulfide interchange protein